MEKLKKTWKKYIATILLLALFMGTFSVTANVKKADAAAKKVIHGYLQDSKRMKVKWKASKVVVGGYYYIENESTGYTSDTKKHGNKSYKISSNCEVVLMNVDVVEGTYKKKTMSYYKFRKKRKNYSLDYVQIRLKGNRVVRITA